MANSDLPDWDWVTSRAACAPDVVYAKLRELAAINVDTRNNQLGGRPQFQVQDFDNAFSVSVSGNDPRRRAVSVRLKDGGEFEVRTQEGELIATARVELTPTEECRLQVGEDLLAPWQFLKRVFEPLLFRDR